MSEDQANAVRFMVARGKVISSTIGPRTMLQIERYQDETFDSVELLLPPGYVAMPLLGADVLPVQVGGNADHKVAVGGDNVTDTVSDLKPGEFGIATNGKRVILRQAYLEVVDPAEIRLVTPSLMWSPDGVTFYRLTTDQHTHADPQGGDVAAPTTGLT